jgi:predicted ATP-binding protein involved in virulence
MQFVFESSRLGFELGVFSHTLMKILSLRIKGLYGYLDKDIDFNTDINLLVGINGSGKTSVFNLINSKLSP